MLDFLNTLPLLTSHGATTRTQTNVGINRNYFGVDYTSPFGKVAVGVLPSFVQSLFDMPSLAYIDKTIHNLGVKNVLNSTLGKNAIGSAIYQWNLDRYNRFAQGLNLLGNLAKVQQQFGLNFGNSTSSSYNYNPNGYLSFLTKLWGV